MRRFAAKKTVVTRKSHQRMQPTKTPKKSAVASLLLEASSSNADMMPRNVSMVMGLIKVSANVERNVFLIVFLWVDS